MFCIFIIFGILHSLTEKSSGSAVHIVDLEEVEPPEETSMLLCDPDLSMPLDDVFEVQEPPVEVWM
jgi:hypothetical protein